eukprot:1035042_1
MSNHDYSARSFARYHPDIFKETCGWMGSHKQSMHLIDDGDPFGFCEFGQNQIRKVEFFRNFYLKLMSELTAYCGSYLCGQRPLHPLSLVRLVALIIVFCFMKTYGERVGALASDACDMCHCMADIRKSLFFLPSHCIYNLYFNGWKGGMEFMFSCVNTAGSKGS